MRLLPSYAIGTRSAYKNKADAWIIAGAKEFAILLNHVGDMHRRLVDDVRYLVTLDVTLLGVYRHALAYRFVA